MRRSAPTPDTGRQSIDSSRRTAPLRAAGSEAAEVDRPAYVIRSQEYSEPARTSPRAGSAMSVTPAAEDGDQESYEPAPPGAIRSRRAVSATKGTAARGPRGTEDSNRSLATDTMAKTRTSRARRSTAGSATRTAARTAARTPSTDAGLATAAADRTGRARSVPTIYRRTLNEPDGDSRRAARASAEDPARDKYVVQPGDTYTSIAVTVYGDRDRWLDLKEANPTLNPKKLSPGYILKVPSITNRPTVGLLPAQPARPMREAKATRPAPVAQAARPYTIRPGDTLSSIAARHYGSSADWKRIYIANRKVIGPNPDHLSVGTKLRLDPATREGS